MKRLTEKEANHILKKLIELRNQCKDSDSPDLHKRYSDWEQYCSTKFDYLVTSKTRKYIQFPNYQDLQQDGRLALVIALRNFDINKGSFFWWANQYIKTRISREANKHSTINIPMKKAKEIQPYKVSEIPTIIDSNPDAMRMLESNEIKQKVNAAIDLLPEEQKKILRLNGIKSYSIKRISKTLKISKSNCVKLLNEAKKNFKENLAQTE